MGKRINFASLGQGMPGLTPANGTTLAEAAAVCLEDRDHRTGVQLRLAGMKKDTFMLEWSAVDEQQKRCYKDMQEATERGACGVAILMVKELTGHVVVERSRKGPGFDYWLGEDDDLLFTGKARLEVCTCNRHPKGKPDHPAGYSPAKPTGTTITLTLVPGSRSHVH
jgi:hypothetical protein